MKKKLELKKEVVSVLTGAQLNSVYGGRTDDTFWSDCMCISQGGNCGGTNDSCGCQPAVSDVCQASNGNMCKDSKTCPIDLSVVGNCVKPTFSEDYCHDIIIGYQ